MVAQHGPASAIQSSALAWQTATNPRVALFRWLLVSAALHWILIGFGGTAPQRPGISTAEKIHVTLRPAGAMKSPAVVDTGRQPASRPVERSRPAHPATGPDVVPASASAGDPTPDRRAPRDDTKVEIARFDPTEYLPPSAVERTAIPVNQELFDFLPLSGFQSGLWLVRLFVDEQGRVVEVELVESSGSERNSLELKAILLANRFMPALRPDGPVKSQKMIEVSFEPGPEALLTSPVPIPSAAGK